MNIIIDPAKINIDLWRQFVAGHPNGGIFHTPEMFKVYSLTKNQTSLVFCCTEQNRILGLLIAVIQKEHAGLIGFFSSRSIIFGGPLVIEDNHVVFDKLLENYNKSLRTRAIYSQIRNSWDTSILKNLYAKANFVYEDHLNILINLNRKTDEIFMEFSQDRRREIRKAYKLGVEVEEINSIDKIPVFYSFLKMVYNRINIPCPELSFINSVFTELVSTGNAKFYLAKIKNQYIGCHSILLYKDIVICWYGGLDRNFSKFFPYETLIWESLNWASKNGYKTFDFQGAGKPEKPYGVRDFKKRFGGDIVNFGRYQKQHHPLLFRFALAGFRFWQLINSFKNKK